MKKRFYLLAILTITLVFSSFAVAQAPVLFDGTNPVVYSFQSKPDDAIIPDSKLITPDDFAKQLQSAQPKPLILEVGPHSLFAQAHIVGAEYIGPTSGNEGKQKLRGRVQSLPKNSAIVLYCGCCPWGHCPNIHAAYQLLHSLGFTNVKALYIADNFGTDWVNHGYPVAKGE